MKMNLLLKFILVLIVSFSTEQIVFTREVNDLERRIIEFIDGKNAQIGVAVIVGNRTAALVNNDFKYPMLSVYKLHQAIAVCNYLQKNSLPLTTVINVSKDELHNNTYSPMREKYAGKDFQISIDELLKYTIHLSDNNACDILFTHICSPSETDSFLRSFGMNDFSIVATEDDMHQDLENCRLNWSYPLEVARLLLLLKNGDMISDPYKSYLIDLLLGCKTGAERLAKPLGSDSLLGHKTGTGDKDEKGRIIGMNDAGFVILPDKREYIIVVFVADSEENERDTEGIISGISKIVHQHYMHDTP